MKVSVHYEFDGPIEEYDPPRNLDVPYKAQLRHNCRQVTVVAVLKWPVTMAELRGMCPETCECCGQPWDWSEATDEMVWGLNLTRPRGLTYELTEEEWIAYCDAKWALLREAQQEAARNESGLS